MICGECPYGKIERILGNGITEPPYIRLVRCPYDSKFYKDFYAECSHEVQRDGAEEK